MNQGADVIKSTEMAASKTVTGLTKVSPDRITTIRQKQHYDDQMRRIEADRQRKAQLRFDLET